MERYDPFADVSDEELRRLHEESPIHAPSAQKEKNPALRFRYDRYDWEGFKAPGQAVVRLTRGYFTFVRESDLKKIGNKRLCAHVDKCPETGRLLKVRALIWDDRIKKTVYLHRFLMSAEKGDIIDHVNNWPLDNRGVENLWSTNRGVNAFNRFYPRHADRGLPRGVRSKNKGFQGQIRFGGKSYFSTIFGSAKEASDWYTAKVKKFYSKKLMRAKPPRTYPVFPPLKTRSKPATKIAGRAKPRIHEERIEIPF